MDNDRKAQRLKRAKRKKILRRTFLIALATGFLLLLTAMILTLLIPRLSQDKPPQSDPSDPKTTIELAFAGDLTVTDKVVSTGETDGVYDYAPVFRDVLPLLSDADHTVLNFEGNLCGAPYGSKHSSAPRELLDALSAAGVDMLQVANSCTINNGLLGLGETLNAIHAAGLESLGAYASPEEFRQNGGFVLRDIQGVKVAFVAFTKGMDNIALPEGQEDCVNLLYTDYTSTYQKVDTDGITRLLQTIEKQKPDITVAMLHWGSEYNSQISKSQERIVKLMKAQGVDAIIGTHSHHLQKLDFDKENGTLVAYSLGDFLGNADRSDSAYSAVLKLQVTKNQVTGETKIAGFEYDPIFIHHSETGAQVLRIQPAIAEYEQKGISAVPENIYNAMTQAVTRIEKLFTQEPKPAGE